MEEGKGKKCDQNAQADSRVTKELKEMRIGQKHEKSFFVFFYILQIDFGTHVLCIPIILLHALHISYWTIF